MYDIIYHSNKNKLILYVANALTAKLNGASFLKEELQK